MITFRQKEFSEYDAMRSLYVELMKTQDRNNKIGIIDTSSLIPILKGNNIVIERFVISTSMFGKDKYRMYLKIGARAKMPEAVRLPGRSYDKRVANTRINFNGGLFGGDKDKDNDQNQNNQQKYNKQKNSSDTVGNERVKLFANNKKGGGGPKPVISTEFSPNIDLTYEVNELLGDAIKYDKKSRSLVLEFNSIQDAIRALNILPFGIGYKIYLLNA